MNANPVRIACQEFSGLADSVGVPQSTYQNKVSSFSERPQITGVLSAALPVSLRQSVFGNENPVRDGIGQSCQDYLEDGGESGPKNMILTGQNPAENCQSNPVRMEVVIK